MINWDKPIQTRGGENVRVVDHHFRPFPGEAADYRIVVVTDDANDDKENYYFVRADGCIIKSNGLKNPRDIVNVPEKRRVWVNLYPADHATKAGADFSAGVGRIACKEIEFIVGEGL